MTKLNAFIVVLLLTFFNVGNRFCKFIDNSEIAIREVQRSLSECKLSIARTVFELGSRVTIANVGSGVDKQGPSVIYDLIVDMMMKEQKWNLLMLQPANMVKTIVPMASDHTVDHYILFINNEDECDLMLDMLLRSSSWNERAKFQVFVGYLEADDLTRFVTYVLAKLWEQFVINVIVNIAVNETSPDSRIFTWMPYEHGNCGTHPERFVQVARCERSQIIPTKVDLFPNKVPPNLNGCPMRIGAFGGLPGVGPPRNTNNTALEDLPNADLGDGYEVKLLQSIANEMNFKPLYMYVGLNGARKMFSYSGSTHIATNYEAIKNVGELAIGNVVFRSAPGNIFEYSSTYWRSNYIFALTTPETMPHWMGMLLIFNPIVWVAGLMLAAVTCIAIWLVARHEVNENGTYTKASNVVFIIVTSMINGVPNIIPNCHRLRFIYLLWLFFCLNWTSAYSSSLITMISTALRPRSPINSLIDALDAGMVTGGGLLLYSYLKNHMTFIEPAFQEMTRRYEICETPNVCLERITNDRNFFAILNENEVTYLQSEFMDTNGELRFRVLPQVLSSRTIHLAIKRGFPLLKRINRYVEFAVEAGLIEYWVSEISEKRRTMAIQKRLASFKEHEPLSLQKLMGSFYVLLLGFVLAAVVFLMEKSIENRSHLWKILNTYYCKQFPTNRE